MRKQFLWIGVLLASFGHLGLVPAAPLSPNSYAEHLLVVAAKMHPDVVAMALSATPAAGSKGLIVAATDQARIGSVSDPVDAAVIEDGKTRIKGDDPQNRLEVHVPLLNVSAGIVGSLTVSYANHPQADRDALLRSATVIRDALARRISHVANLLEPYPFDPKYAGNTYAQQLVEETLAKYPMLEIFALHATPPDSKQNVIIGSNIGRIGKLADEDDLRVVTTGKPNLEVNESGDRFEVEMQLHDRTGRVIGAISTVFAYRKGDDKAALRARGEAINAEVQQRIPDSASLFRQIP